MGYTRDQRLWRVELPLAVPADRGRAAHRQRLDDRAGDDHGDARRPRSAASASSSSRATPRVFPTEILVGADPVDRAGRRRRPAPRRASSAGMTPWARRRASRRCGHGSGRREHRHRDHRLADRPGQLDGPERHPGPPRASTSRISGSSLVIALRDRPADRAVDRSHGAGATAGRRPRPTSGGRVPSLAVIGHRRCRSRPAHRPGARASRSTRR